MIPTRTSPDPGFEWLLQLARPTLDPGAIMRVNALAGAITDWSVIADKAREQMLAPLIYHHLRHWPEQPWLAQATDALRDVAHAMTLRTLRHAAVQKRFIERHLAPLGIEFAIVKGRALAQRYYPDPGLRPARDIDIWMRTKDMVRLVESAQAAGFVVHPCARAVTAKTLALHFMRQQGIALYDRHDVLIELDERLDKTGQFFPIDAYLPACEQHSVDGLTIKVLPTAELFIYVCLHHTRHHWAKLMWLADINALRSAPDYDEQAIRQKAQRMRLLDTVDATLLFADACRSQDPWAAAQQDERVLGMLRDCHSIYRGGRAVELAVRQQRQSPDLAYRWQLPDGEAPRSAWMRPLKMLQPSLNDYHMLPLPLSLYPLYYLLRPGLFLIRRTQRILARLRTPPATVRSPRRKH